MKFGKKLLAAVISVAMAVTMFASAFSASAAGIASSMLTPNQRLIYDELVKTYVTDFSYGSTTSFKLMFKDQFDFDETEAAVETADAFLAVSMFVADYAYALPWIDYEGAVMEEYPLPFVGAVSTQVVFEIELNLVIAMFAVKEEYQGNVGDLYGYKNITIIDPNPATVDTGNLAIGAVATADSTAQNADGTPRDDLATELGNDGDYATRWQAQTNASASTPCWYALDFGEAKSFDKIRMYWETARATEDGFVIQYSDDGEAWTDATIVDKNRTQVKIGNNDEYFDDVVIEPVTARHVRVYVTVAEKVSNVSLYEFEVYSGEVPEIVADPISIEVTKAPDKTEYYAGTYPYVDLTGMELTVTYSDNTTKVMTSSELEAIRGYGSKDVFFAFVDDYTSSISISYLGLETTTPITLIPVEEPLVTNIEVVTAPIGEGLRGIVFNAYDAEGTATELTIAEDAIPVQATNMMGIAVETYALEYMGEKYLAIGLSYAGGGMLEGVIGGMGGEDGDAGLGDILEGGFSIITFMGCAASTVPVVFVDFTLTEDSEYLRNDAYQVISNIPEGTTVAEFKTNFVEDVQLIDYEGNVYADDTVVADGMLLAVNVDGEYINAWYMTCIGAFIAPEDLTLTLTEDSVYLKDDEGRLIFNIAENTTVAEFKTNFVEAVQLTDYEGNVYADDAIVTTGMWVMVNVDGKYQDTLYTTYVEEEFKYTGLTLTDDSVYNLDDVSGYIFNVSANTTVAEFKKNFVEDIMLADDDGNIYDDDDLVGTGAWILSSVDGEGYVDTWYQPVICGDVNGDGKINSTDFMQIRKSFLGTYELGSNAQYLAADTNGDGKINSTDFMQVRRHFLGLFDLYA